MQELAITERALERLNDLLARNKSDMLFLGIIGKGCGGNKFSLNFTGTVSANPVKLNNGLLYIEPSAQPWLNGLVIDYAGDRLNPSFHFHHAEHRLCGCGESFTVTKPARAGS